METVEAIAKAIDNGFDYIKDFNSSILSKMLKEKKNMQNIEKNKSWHS